MDIAAQHAHVIDRAMHGKRADAAAGEKERGDGVGVRAHGQRFVVGGRNGQQGGVVHAVQERVGEMAQEALADEALRGATAASGIQQYAVIHK